MITSRRYPVYKYVLAALDWCTIVAAYAAAFVAEGRWLVEHPDLGGWLLAGLIGFVATIGVLTVYVFHHFGLYQIHVFVTIVDHVLQIVKGLLIVLVSVAVLSFFIRLEFIVDSRLLTGLFALAAFVMLITVRVVVFRQIYLYLSRNKVLQRPTLILGAKDNGRNVAVNLFLHDYIGLRVVGFLDDELLPETAVFNGARVLGKVDDLDEIVKRHHVEEVLICLENIDYTRLMEIMERAVNNNLIVKIASPLYEIVPLRRAIEHYGNIPVIGVFQSGMTPKRELFKRVFDVAFASIIFVLHLPLFIMIAVAIKLDSRGPILYKQQRVGKNGKEFFLYKFRSMTVGGNDDDDRKKQMADFIKDKRKYDPNAPVSTKIVNAARVTRTGKWLRKLSLDELPQLINVLKGEMSLVGPRPCLPYEWAHYEEWHKRRLSVLPGLTGMWQVSGRSVVGFEDMVILDLHYIQNASLLLDVRVLIKTIPVMLFGTGGK